MDISLSSASVTEHIQLAYNGTGTDPDRILADSIVNLKPTSPDQTDLPDNASSLPINAPSLPSPGIAPAQTNVVVSEAEDTTIAQFEIMEPNTATTEDVEYPTGIKFAFVFMALLVSLALIGLDLNILATAVPAITTHFQTVTDIGWYYSAYRFTSCSFQFMFGKMYTIFSVKVVLLTTLCIFELGSIIAGSATSSAVLILGRAISGFGSGGVVAGLFT